MRLKERFRRFPKHSDIPESLENEIFRGPLTPRQTWDLVAFSLDWTQRDTVRADMRRTIRWLLTKYGYPPDAQEGATQLVIRQAELMADKIVES
jgi:hypothetical protein